MEGLFVYNITSQHFVVHYEDREYVLQTADVLDILNGDSISDLINDGTVRKDVESND